MVFHFLASLLLDKGFHLFYIYLSCLPDELYVLVFFDTLEGSLHGVIDGASTQTAAHYQDGFLGHIEAEAAHGFIMVGLMGEQVLTHRVAREYDFVGREEVLHALIGHTDLAGTLGEQLIRYTGERVLLLYQDRNTHLAGSLQGRAAGKSAYAHSYLWLEVLDDLTRHPQTLGQFH